MKLKYLFVLLLIFLSLPLIANETLEYVGRVNTQALNVRASANAKSNILHVLKENTSVVVNYDAGNSWVNISFTSNNRNYTGFVNKKYLQIREVYKNTYTKNDSNYSSIFSIIFAIAAIILMIFAFQKRFKEEENQVLDKSDCSWSTGICSSIFLAFMFFMFTQKYLWVEHLLNIISSGNIILIILLVVIGGVIVFYLNFNECMFALFYTPKISIFYILTIIAVAISSISLSLSFFGDKTAIEQILLYEYNFHSIGISLVHIVLLLSSLFLLTMIILNFEKSDIWLPCIAVSISSLYIYFIFSLIISFIIAILPVIGALAVLWVISSDKRDRLFYDNKGNYQGYSEAQDSEGIAIHRDKYGKKIGFSKKNK